MKLVLLALLALSAPLIAVPTAAAHSHCEDYPYHTEIVCRVFAALDELLPPIDRTLP